MSEKQKERTCGKNLETVVADSTNLKDIKEAVKKFRNKTKTYLWYRIENRKTETESNCTYFLAIRSFKFYEFTICTPLNFKHFIICKKTENYNIKTTSKTSETVTASLTKTQNKKPAELTETPENSYWPLWQIVVVVFGSLLVVTVIAAIAYWCKKVSFKPHVFKRP